MARNLYGWFKEREKYIKMIVPVTIPAAPVLDRRIEVVLDGDEEGLFSSFFSLVGEDLSLLVLLL